MLWALLARELLFWSLEKDVKTALFTWNFITKFPTLGSVIGIPQCSGEFICIKENGNILRRRKHGGQFIEYNAQKDEHIEFSVKEIHKYMGQMPLYVESLVSLEIPWDLEIPIR